ncbi:MAG: hypothetical protein BWZ02_01392 [Lentisphaerae bacterium ADurb.BinA184]|nr:MAG: hypothetical protein BWZ02_01392 [Lentisphaerae bacterium ADurb.BinA184]
MESLEQLVACGQLLQAEGLKCLFEEARRQKPRAAMALNWCFNEPWPCAANMSILSWPAEPKAAYAAVQGSLRPVLASARLAKFRWRQGELFAAELWLLNDSPAAVPGGRVEAWLDLAGDRRFLLAWDHAGAAANTNLPGPVVRVALPCVGADHFRIGLECPGQPGWNSAYYLRLVPPADTASPATPPLNL